MEQAVRWNIKVSKEIDLTLRTDLGAQGMKKGDLSKFIEDAVRWRIFNRTVQDIKSRNSAADPGELQAIIDGAVREAHAERRSKRKAKRLLRVVLDTNILVSALIAPVGNPAAI